MDKEILIHPRLLKSFVVMSEELHFGRAAKRLGVAQSTLSEHIQSLEDTLDMVIFARHTREVRLTPEGVRLVPLAQQRLVDARRFVEDAKRVTQQVAGVRLGCLPGQAGHWMSFARGDHRPDICPIEISALSLREAVDELRNGQLDAMLCTLPGERPLQGFGWIHLGDDICHFAMAADHPLAGQPTVTLDDVRGYPIFCPDGYLHHFEREITVRLGEQPVKMRSAISILHVAPALANDKAVYVAGTRGLAWIKEIGLVLRPFAPTWTTAFGIMFPDLTAPAMTQRLTDIADHILLSLESDLPSPAGCPAR